MEISVATLQLALLFIPGLIWAMLDAAHRPPAQSGQFVYTLRVFVFGVVSYAIVGGLYAANARAFDLTDFSSANWKFSSSIDELLYACVTAVVLAIAWMYGRTHKIITRLLSAIWATNHIADQDIWEFMFNSDNPKIKYTHVRDYENSLIYAGYVQAYSERQDLRELAMYDVIVYSENSEKLYEAPYLYLARPISSITLEFPHKEKLDDKGYWAWIAAYRRSRSNGHQ